MTTPKDANTAGEYRLEMPDRRTIVLHREGESERLSLVRDHPNAAFATLHNDAVGLDVAGLDTQVAPHREDRCQRVAGS